MNIAFIKKFGLNLLKAIVALSLLWLIVTRTGFTPEVFFKTIFKTHPVWFLASLPGVLIVLWIKAFRWNLLMRQQSIFFSQKKSFIAYLTSFFIGLLTPGRVGEIVKVYYVRSLPGSNLFKSFQTVIADRFYDLYFLAGFGLVSYCLIFKENQMQLIFSAILAVLAGLPLLKLFLNIIKPYQAHQGIVAFIHGSLSMITSPHAFYPWVSTLAAYLAFFFQSWLIAKSLDIPIDFLSLASIMTLTSVILLLPITWAGMGTRELSLVILMAPYGVAAEKALAFSFLQFTSSFFIGGITGFIFWLSLPIPREELQKDYTAIKRLLRANASTPNNPPTIVK